MATESKPNPVAQFGPIAAPALGGLLLVVFVAVVYISGNISGEQARLDKAIRDVNARRDSSKAELPQSTLPSVTAVMDMVTPDNRDGYRAPEGERKLNSLPIVVRVTIQDREQNEFEEYDTDKDGRWSETEFRKSPYGSMGGRLGKFAEWDRNGDKFIDQNEYKDPPKEDEERFKELDLNNDGFLTAPDEITSDELRKWDRPDVDNDDTFDNKISLQEYKDRYKPDETVALAPVKSVGVTFDPERMEIVVTWDAPAEVPSDASFLIERYSPETREQRRREHDGRVRKYNADLRAWEERFEKWWESPAEDGQRKNKDVHPNKILAKQVFAKVDSPPVPPAQPEDWEIYAEATGNEFRDVGFETDATYTYAVRVLTGKPLKRGLKRDITYGSKRGSTRVVQPNHPVRVPNRVILSWNSGGENTGIILTKWLRYGTGQDSAWYRVSITESVNNNTAPNLGGEYTAAQIKERQGKVIKVGETAPADITSVLGSGKMDFRTGYRFVTNTKDTALFTHPELGDFDLPKATKGNLPAQPAPSTESSLEVRVYGMTNYGRPNVDATFEITRWHQVDDKWYRVVMLRKKVRVGEEVGANCDFSSPPEGVKIYDSAGVLLNAAALRNIKGGTVNMTVGKFEGAAERHVTVGGEKFDLFGTLYR
ncbi:MAG: hypothetical protein HS108_16010 [Planctomycetes bacterium]|nr:hypothetical protein [Planctomycetota bacterium]